MFASGRVVNDRRGAGRADFVCSCSLGKQSRPYWAARQSKTLDSEHTLLVSLPLEHAVEVRQASSAHLTRAGMCEMSWSWAASSRSSRSSSESFSPRIMARKSSARRRASSTVSPVMRSAKMSALAWLMAQRGR